MEAILATFETTFILPEVLYHGTTMGAILHPEGFTKKSINEQFMRSDKSRNRDFGTGFYTTVDFRQAARWARKSIMGAWEAGVSGFEEKELPVIVQIQCIKTTDPQKIDVLDFRGESNEWSDFILSHRFQSSLHDCYCLPIDGRKHPRVICGPMADNDTGDVIANFKKLGKLIDNQEDRTWFRNQITQTENGERRLGLELGDQIAWFGEELNSVLQYNEYHKINVTEFLGDQVNETNYRKEWDYYA